MPTTIARTPPKATVGQKEYLHKVATSEPTKEDVNIPEWTKEDVSIPEWTKEDVNIPEWTPEHLKWLASFCKQ